MNNRVIITMSSAEKQYIDMLKVFLLSLARTGSEEEVFAYIPNGDKNHFRISKLYNNCTIGIGKEGCKTPVEILYSRLPVIMNALKSGADFVLSIDSDVLFIKNPKNIFDNSVPDSIKIWDKGIVASMDGTKRSEKVLKNYLFKKSIRFNTRLQGGVFILGNGEKTKEYWEDICKNCLGSMDGYLVQRLMYFGIEKHGLRHINMSPCYNDSCFNDSSVMWHAKSGCRDNAKYRRVFNEILSSANKILGE